MMAIKTIAVTNQKGAQGKTQIATLLGAGGFSRVQMDLLNDSTADGITGDDATFWVTLGGKVRAGKHQVLDVGASEVLAFNSAIENAENRDLVDLFIIPVIITDGAVKQAIETADTLILAGVEPAKIMYMLNKVTWNKTTESIVKTAAQPLKAHADSNGLTFDYAVRFPVAMSISGADKAGVTLSEAMELNADDLENQYADGKCSDINLALKAGAARSAQSDGRRLVSMLTLAVADFSSVEADKR